METQFSPSHLVNLKRKEFEITKLKIETPLLQDQNTVTVQLPLSSDKAEYTLENDQFLFLASVV